MNFVKKINQYNNEHVYFCEPIKNNIMNEGNFIRILYSTHNIIFNGIYLLLSFTDINVEKYYNKYRCSFNIYTNKEMIDSIKEIEVSILEKINIKNKTPQYKIYDQFKCGNIKLFNDNMIKNNNNNFILKISGIWETQNNYGLTYKFIKTN
jgi:hypothetical protein